MGALSKFIRKHSRPYEVRVKNGKGAIRVQFYEGYVVLISRQPGLQWHREVAITRTAWYELLRSVGGPTKMMEGPDFDQNEALRAAYQAEQLLLAEKRERRKLEDVEARTIAQRRRHARAQARARRAQT